MKLNDAIVRRIEEICKERSSNVCDIALKGGMSPSAIYDLIKGIKDGFTAEGVEGAKNCEARLKALAESEISRKDGYFKVHGKRYGNIR